MAQITWGDGEGAGKVHFNGHVSLSGCALLNAGAANEGVVLAQYPYTSDANTGLLLHLNGDGVDASSYGTNATLKNSPTFGNTWLNQCITLNGSSQYLDCGDVTTFDGLQALTVECWFKAVSFPSPGLTSLISKWATGKLCFLFTVHDFTGSRQYLRFHVSDGTNQVAGYNTTGTFVTGQWYHVAGVWSGGTTLALYINGVLQSVTYNAQRAVSGLANVTEPLQLGSRRNTAGAQDWYINGDIDEARISRVARSLGDLHTVRYKSSAQNGSVQPYVDLSNTGLSGQIPSSISWNAQTGASYGQVKAVYILDAALGWTQVGGAYPTSPITVSGLTLGADSCVRFALEPKADTIQSETPTLQDVTLEYNAPSTAITEAAPWTIGATATLTVRDVSGEQFASNGRRAQSYLPSIGRLAQEFFASGGRRAQDYLPTKGGRG